MPKGTGLRQGWGQTWRGWLGTALRTKSLIVLQSRLFGKISIIKSSCCEQSGVSEIQSQRKHGLGSLGQQNYSLQVKVALHS